LSFKNAFISKECSEVHGLTLQSPCIQSAKPLKVVWQEFVQFIEMFLDGSQKHGVIIAWNGTSCDLEWLFKLPKKWKWE